MQRSFEPVFDTAGRQFCLHAPSFRTISHLRCGQVEVRIVYHYNGTERYEQFLQVGQLHWALSLVCLALYLPNASISSVLLVLSIVVLYL